MPLLTAPASTFPKTKKTKAAAASWNQHILDWYCKKQARQTRA